MSEHRRTVDSEWDDYISGAVEKMTKPMEPHMMRSLRWAFLAGICAGAKLIAERDDPMTITAEVQRAMETNNGPRNVKG